MKLEWGKKVYCPACALPFYDMQKTSLICPSCGNKFEAADLRSKKHAHIAMDEIDLDDKITEIPGFEFVEDETVDLSEDSDGISVPEEIEDIKLVDEE